MDAFITGSRAFGKPTKASDIDVVIRCTKEVARKLFEQAQEHLPLTECGQSFPDYENMESISMRFGPLNLLCCLDNTSYHVWEQGTKKLKAIGPVDRPVAVALFKQLEREQGQAALDDDATDRAEGKGKYAPKFPKFPMPEGVPRG